MKILIADDDELALKILRRYLEKWGHEVAEARDGEEAWKLAQEGAYPIVITDWTMPNLSGVELIRRLRSSSVGACMYTILITGRSSKEDLVQGMEAGADDFVCKPYDRDELRVRLREGERIVALERALAEADGSRVDRLRARVVEAIDEADRNLERAKRGLAEHSADIGAVLEHLSRAREALGALRTDTTT